MKKKRIGGVLLAMALIGCLCGCGKKEPGTPPDLVLDGHTIIVGESTPNSLGLGVKNPQYYVTSMPDRSWTSQLFFEDYLVRVTLANETKEEQQVGDCVIHEVEFFDLDDEKNRSVDVTINGINPLGMTEDELKEAFPDLELDDDEKYRFDYLRSGSDYYVRFEYIDGVQDSIEIVHDFDKSYQEK